MPSRYEIVLASNRGPVSFVERDGHFSMHRGAGGLAGALHPVARRLGGKALWICAAGSDDDRKAVAQGMLKQLPERLGYPVQMLDLPQGIYDRYYNDISNRLLWFANHCLWSELGPPSFGKGEVEAWTEAYEPVNRRFADAVAESSPPESPVMFHDYHLAVAPSMLKELAKDRTIFHFTHSSFCGPPGLNVLPPPIVNGLIHGMLGADLLGFQIDAWVEGFYASCEQLGMGIDRRKGLVEHEEGSSWVRPYPIPIDAEAVRRRAEGKTASKWARTFRAYTGPVIVRADRAELSKNVVRGFQAYRLLLDRRPDLREARFVACLYPSRESMPEYRAYIERIYEVVSEVNSRYPGSIQLFMKNDYERTLGAMRVADVMLVNSIMDGMNLVSKEAAAVSERDACLVLSRRAGSFAELGEFAVPLEDPFDIEETAAALETALDMPQGERRRRAEGLRRVVEEETPEGWIKRQIEDLDRVRRGLPPATPPAT